MTIRIAEVLRALSDHLGECGVDFALIGGLAVSARTEPRFTRDVDVAISVVSDEEAERVVTFLRKKNYRVEMVLEQTETNRLSTVRFTNPEFPGIFADLLFASSGIEPEIVATADTMTMPLALEVKVATVAHLIATKILSQQSNRPQDTQDLRALFDCSGDEDLQLAREALKQIQIRGFHRSKNLIAEFERLWTELSGSE